MSISSEEQERLALNLFLTVRFEAEQPTEMYLSRRLRGRCLDETIHNVTLPNTDELSRELDGTLRGDVSLTETEQKELLAIMQRIESRIWASVQKR